MKDIATVLGDVAINSHHTPALYSTFLRALISARTDAPQQQSQQPQQQPQQQQIQQQQSQPQTEVVVTDEAAAQHDMSLFGPTMSMDGVNDFHFTSEMGPVADMSKFPPTMATLPASDEGAGMLSMENFFPNGFWDSVLVPGTLVLNGNILWLTKAMITGYSDTMEGLSGGFVFGAGGSGLITPGWLSSPLPSGHNTPRDLNTMDYQQNLGSTLMQRKC